MLRCLGVVYVHSRSSSYSNIIAIRERRGSTVIAIHAAISSSRSRVHRSWGKIKVPTIPHMDGRLHRLSSSCGFSCCMAGWYMHEVCIILLAAWYVLPLHGDSALERLKVNRLIDTTRASEDNRQRSSPLKIVKTPQVMQV